MSTQPPLPALTGARTVHLPIERAFQFFTESFNAWWPPQYHIGRADLAEAVLEGRVGGRWYERGVDGSECDWGHVRVWEPPHRLVVTWQINGYWQYDPDPGHATKSRSDSRRPGQTRRSLKCGTTSSSASSLVNSGEVASPEVVDCHQC